MDYKKYQEQYLATKNINSFLAKYPAHMVINEKELTFFLIVHICDTAKLSGHRYKPTDNDFRVKKYILGDDDYVPTSPEDDKDYHLFIYRFFNDKLKGTFDADIAYLFLYIIAYAHHLNIPLYQREYRKERTGSIYFDLYKIIHYIDEAHHHVPGKDWGYVLAAIEIFCEWHEINLPLMLKIILKYESFKN